MLSEAWYALCLMQISSVSPRPLNLGGQRAIVYLREGLATLRSVSSIVFGVCGVRVWEGLSSAVRVFVAFLEYR